MLPSELARELGWEPSLMTKRRAAYYEHRNRGREDVLSEETVADLRKVREVMRANPGLTFRAALDLHFDGLDGPVPAKAAQMLAERLQKVEESQARVEAKMDSIATYLRRLLLKRGDDPTLLDPERPGLAGQAPADGQ